MNRTPDVELVLRDYFADDGAAAADHVLDIVADRIGRQPQRRGWRLRGRPVVNTQVKLAAAVAASLAVAIVAWQFLPSTNIPGATPTPAPPASTAEPSAAADMWWMWGLNADGEIVAIEDCGDAPEPPGCAGELNPGSYTSVGFDPAVTYAVPAGWVNGRDWANDFGLFPATDFIKARFAWGGGPAADVAVHVIDLAGLVCPRPPLSGWPEGPIGSQPADVVDHIVRTQEIGRARNQTSVTIGGLRGEQVELDNDPGWTCQTRPAGGSGAFHHRLIVLALPDGRPVAIEIRKSAWAGVDVDFDQFARDAMQVILSFRFEGAG